MTEQQAQELIEKLDKLIEKLDRIPVISVPYYPAPIPTYPMPQYPPYHPYPITITYITADSTEYRVIQ